MRKTLKTGRCHFRKSTGLKTGHYNDKSANSRNSRKCALREQAPPRLHWLRVCKYNFLISGFVTTTLKP